MEKGGEAKVIDRICRYIQGVELNADRRCRDELIEISNKLMGTLAQIFEAITRFIRRNVDNPIALQESTNFHKRTGLPSQQKVCLPF